MSANTLKLPMAEGRGLLLLLVWDVRSTSSRLKMYSKEGVCVKNYASAAVWR